MVEYALSLLTQQQKLVIEAIVLNGRTETEVAEELGTTKQAVNRIKSRAIKRLISIFISE